ncbi:M16 family metallopeptidase [Pseudoprimorskyibacter insulae]|uniref:Putative zinc protease n=1 Tax=Pseudoprimorskyibacter insulae TaxID=1695997 RepID=A0A2R8AV30_9RHOB|nr:pitrilysin family protein [Pseudoprimorskyibacter insulae]SPF79898.1 putative zinc protease [Pseudoprimorskyibacter insulae]
MKYLLAFALTILSALPLRAEINIQEIETPAGFDVWLVEEHSIPFVALELRFKGGASLDLPGKRGATYLMTGLLEEGAGPYDARGFAEGAEAIAANFDYDTYDDSIAISAKFLTETSDQALALLRESLINPRFDDVDVDRVRQQVLTGLQGDAKDPDTIASNRFSALAYGDHPYATAYEGTIESVQALTREDLQAAHQGAMAKDRVYISAAGDITPDELARLVDALLADLPETGLPMPGHVDVAMPGGTIVVPFETPQSVALFGHEGIAIEDPDYFAAYVMNVVLGGGGFEARLMDEVREKRGLTYGVYSYLVSRDHAAIYAGRVASANDRIAEAIEVIRAEWAKMRDNGVSEDELRRAKTYLTGAYPLRFDGNNAIANILVGMQMQGFPADYVETRNDRVTAVTQDDVARVAKRLLKPEALTFVVVGQPEGLEATAN